jgi:glycosyltransferase involved in cell wall biosynthesis
MFKSDGLPLVSVIIPTYNRCKLLQLAVESVLAQTYPAIELIVVDDGSTDDTPNMLKQYAGRIVYIRKINQGGTAARNTGIKAAHGEHLSFLDHDDLLMPTKIERQMEIMNARPEVGLVHCGYYRMDKDGNYIDKVNFLPEGDVRKEIVCGCFLWSGAPLIRRECINRVGMFDETVWSSDADLWLRIALAGYHFGCVQEPLGAYRILPDSAMADVARTERMDMSILERVFSNPRLSAEVLAMKTQAYFNQRFWLSCRYYTIGEWEDAQRNLTEAISLRPELLERTLDFLHLLCTNALDPRVDDPVKFVNNVFDHLPLAVDEVIRPHHSYLLSWVYAGLAMRNYAYGRIADAKRQFAQAIALDRTIVERTDDFARALCDYALRLPVTPHLYIDTVLQNLPAEGQQLAQLRSRVVSEISIASAFQDYSTGNQHLVPQKVLAALRYRPSWLANKGVVSIFVKSLPRLMKRRSALQARASGTL